MKLLKKGQRVRHDFSLYEGEIIDVNLNDPQGYLYKVKFYKKDLNKYYTDWFKPAVLEVL